MAEGPFAVFRADASAEIGGGHVRRCLTLADALADVGWRCVFAVRPGTRHAVRRLDTARHEIWDMPGTPGEEPAAMAAQWPEGCDLLAVDHYGHDAAFERACRPWAKRVAVLDDLADRPHDCDVLLDQSSGRAAGDYDGLVSDRVVRLIGPAYALLDPAFRAARATARRRRQVGRVLVSCGLVDAADATGHALDAVAMLGGNIAVDVAVGSACPHLDALRAKAEALRPRAKVHVDTDDMAGLMARADLAIGTPGTTSWERCCLGLPAVLITTAQNQQGNARALAEAGAAMALGPVEGVTAAAIAAAIAGLRDDPERLAAMSEIAAALCDGRGAARVRTALPPPPRARDGAPVRLRPATADDEAIMLDWQRDPGTRRFARDPSAPSEARHRRWYARKLADPGCLFNVVLKGETPAGALRFDRREQGGGSDPAYEVSILIAPGFHRQGLGSAALALGRLLLPAAEILATVLPGNEASHHLFRAAGFRPRGDGYVLPPVVAGRAAVTEGCLA